MLIVSRWHDVVDNRLAGKKSVSGLKRVFFLGFIGQNALGNNMIIGKTDYIQYYYRNIIMLFLASLEYSEYII